MTPDLSLHAFRVEVPAQTALYARDALVIDPDGLVIDELTVGGRYRWTWASAGLSVTGIGAWSPRIEVLGLGNLVADLQVVSSSPRVATAFGARLGAWVGPAPAPQMWGTVGEATLPTYSLAITAAGAYGPFLWSVRTGLKMQVAPGFDGYGYAEVLDLQTGVVWVQAVAGPVAVVGEVEALLDPSPFNVRLLARISPNQSWTIDAGCAMGLPGFYYDPTVDLIFAARRRW